MNGHIAVILRQENNKAVSVQSASVCVCAHHGAVIAHSAASSQTGVEIGNAVRAADRSVLMDPAATVHVATARQVPVGHRQGRTAQTDTENLC